MLLPVLLPVLLSVSLSWGGKVAFCPSGPPRAYFVALCLGRPVRIWTP